MQSPSISHKTHRAALIFISLALSQTSVYTARPQGLVHRAVCQFMYQFSLVLTVYIHGRMARLSWPGWVGYIPTNRHPSQY